MRVEQPFNLGTVGLAKMDWERREQRHAKVVSLARDVYDAVEQQVNDLFTKSPPCAIAGNLNMGDGMGWRLDTQLPSGEARFE